MQIEIQNLYVSDPFWRGNASKRRFPRELIRRSADVLCNLLLLLLCAVRLVISETFFLTRYNQSSGLGQVYQTSRCRFKQDETSNNPIIQNVKDYIPKFQSISLKQQNISQRSGKTGFRKKFIKCEGKRVCTGCFFYCLAQKNLSVRPFRKI